MIETLVITQTIIINRLVDIYSFRVLQIYNFICAFVVVFIS